MNPNTLLWSFVGAMVCAFLLVAIVVIFVWDRAEETGKEKGRGEMAQAHGELLAENKRLKLLVANGPMQYLISDGSQRAPQIGPGVEYSESRKWKGLQPPVTEGGK